jgi:hypothetical protein
LVVGHQIEIDVTEVDENGEVVFDDPEEEGGPPIPRTVKQKVASPSEDFMFAADDPQWEGKSEEEIAAAQRELVLAELTKREEAQPPAQAAESQLPGVGEAL